jgi:hypothetical protein
MKASVTLQDIALVQMQGGTIGATVEYPGFSNRRNAERAAQRDLRALATPLLSCTIYCGQEAADLDIGDTFKFEWPDYHSGAIVMRVTGMAFGDGRTDRIRIDCVQDVFAAPLESILSEDRGSLWTNPTAPPTNIEEGEASVSSDSDQLIAATTQIATEMPYRKLVDYIGPRDIDAFLAETPDVGILQTTGKRPASGVQEDGSYAGNAINALIHVDAGSGYVQKGTAGFCGFARLSEDIDFLTSSLTVIDAQDLSAVRIGTFAQIDDELVRVDSISGSTVTVGRGVLDTVPTTHAAGAGILFWQDPAGTDRVEYEATESINVKLQPRNNSGTASLASAVAMPLTFDSRAIRPYPPGNVKINGVAYPETDLGGAPLVVTWAHRDRLQQTGATFEDTTEGNIGPEAGTTYTVRLEDSLGGVITEETGITGTEWAEQSDASDTDNEIVVKLWSVRDGYASWQQHVIPVLRAPLPVESSEIVSESEVEWTPADITTALWLDAADADTITRDVSNVIQWDDKSGNGRNATQGTSGNQPTYQTNVLNGLPVVRFDGSNDRLDFSTGISSANDIAVYVVYRRASTGIRSFPVGADTTSNPYPLWWDTDNVSYSSMGTSGFNTHGSASTKTGGILDAITRSSSGTLIYRFGAAMAAAQSATGSNNLTRIGGRSNVFHNGDIAEVIIVGNLNNREKIEGYLAHKWGLSGDLPIDHPYKDDPPTV